MKRTMKKFFKLNPRTFSGMDDPMTVGDWIDNMRDMFEDMNRLEEIKVIFVVLVLEREVAT